MNQLEEKALRIIQQLSQDLRLRQYVDETLPIPQPYRGLGVIRFIVVGQDPTVRDAERRKVIRTVLNLDRNGSVRAYLEGVYKRLRIQLTENVYATNLYKNFFVRLTTQILEIDIFREFLDFWLPVFEEELREFVDIPVITLGQPVLMALVLGPASTKVRDYWGYTLEWMNSGSQPLRYIQFVDNRLKHIIFPFPHQPSLHKYFYKAKMKSCVSFVKAVAFS